MKAPGAVLFDMDGVIFDSERALMGCWLELAEERGLRDMEAVYRRCIGVTLPVTGGILREAYGEDFPWREFRQESTRRYLARYGGGKLPVKPGARELLRSLNGRGIPLALASSTEGAMVRRWLEEAGLLPCFDRIVSGDMVSHSKPHPEIFLTAAAALGVDPADCLVIEDSYNGVRAASAAGMRPVMVPDLLAPDGEMDSLAEAILPDLRAVREYFEKGE